VLLAEDEVLVACLLEDMLADLGCATVGPAARVDQALALIEAKQIDAAMLDINLNGSLSYPIADALIARGIPFLFSTGYDRDRVREGYRSRPTLQKPFHASELGRALAALLPAQEPGSVRSVATR
jgi:CheY-like chemotaxis protein